MKKFLEKNKIYNILRCMSLILLIGLTESCSDDVIYNVDDFPSDGKLHMSVAFEPLYGMANTTRTPGNAIKDLDSFAIVFFDKDGKLFKVINQNDPEIVAESLKINQTGNTDIPEFSKEDIDNGGHKAESNTPMASFTLQNIPDGMYKIYAVVNMGMVSDEMAADENTLKDRILEWKSNVASNNQMFGYFTQVAEGAATYKPGDFDAPVLTISQKNSPKLSAWVRRAASKVTIAYDASGLKQNVWIYINKVTIKDIPKTCYLGKTNSPESRDDLIEEGGVLYYNNDGVVSEDKASTDYKDWLTLTNKLKVPVGSSHSETSQALFFYENMQGDFEGQEKYDKRQKKDYLGVLVDPGDPDYKDEREFGTYIEVEAFYNSENIENFGSGKIIYRFMLGKNITYNYNAERNHHYKLTLVFNGWANQADWHIEYTAEDPSIQTPDQFYMPYLYNQKADFPFKLNGNVQSLHVEIIENGWAPVTLTDHQVPPQSDDNFDWNLPAYEMFGPLQNEYPQLGFLALAVPNDTGEPEKNIIDDKDYRDHSAVEDLKDLYEEEHVTDGYTWSQCDRWYNVSPGTHQKGNNEYTVIKADKGDAYTVQIPLWTRNKTMIMNSGYTGNNPYEAFERKAVIKITAEFKDAAGNIQTLDKEVPIYQVRRIVNPKGIWRSRSDSEDFLVHLMTLNSPGDSKYTPLQSVGSWSASIESGATDFCYLADNSGVKHDVIEGDTDSEIKFYVKFNGTLTSGTKGCVININYNGTSCTHKILVRQGYDTPVALVEGGARWSSFNLFSCQTGRNNSAIPAVAAEVACNPLAIGSLFKRRNYSQAILVSNNNTYGPLVPLNGNPLQVKAMNESVTEATWDNILAYKTENNTTYNWATFTATPPGSSTANTYRVPTYDDYKALDNAEYAVGVVYADGARGTLDTFDAYGYEDGSNSLSRSPNGVRGYLVYNKDSGNQVFFPLGKYGMARRTQFNVTTNAQRGYLRYATTGALLTQESNLWRPIVYDLRNNPGAVYWINRPYAGGHPDGYCCGWDMNYFSLDFSSYTDNNSNDACPLKLVVDE